MAYVEVVDSGPHGYGVVCFICHHTEAGFTTAESAMAWRDLHIRTTHAQFKD